MDKDIYIIDVLVIVCYITWIKTRKSIHQVPIPYDTWNISYSKHVLKKIAKTKINTTKLDYRVLQSFGSILVLVEGNLSVIILFTYNLIRLTWLCMLQYTRHFLERYQKHTAMYNWSLCILGILNMHAQNLSTQKLLSDGQKINLFVYIRAYQFLKCCTSNILKYSMLDQRYITFFLCKFL